MARQVSNVDIITDSFEILILQTNELLNSLSTEIITANATYANTGTTANKRTAQLYGTLGANTVVVTDSIQGGNVNGLSANLVISTNATAYSASDANIKVLVGNSSVNSYLGTDTLALGLGTSNTLANTTLVKVEDAGSSANMTADGFISGISVINTTSVAVGANVIANSSAFFVGNSTVNSVVSSATVTTDGTLDVLGTSTLRDTLDVTGLSTLSGNMNTPTANASVAVNVGANATINTSAFFVGNSSVNTSITSTAVDTDGTLSVLKAGTFSNTLAVTGATTLSNTVGVTGAATFSNTIAVTNTGTFSNTLSVTGAATFSNTIAVTNTGTFSNTLNVTGATTLSNTLSIAGNTTFKTDYVIDVSSNTNLGDDSAPKLIYSFAKATYNSAKFQVKIDQEDGSVTQSSEILLALSASSNAVSITTYGSVASNGTPSALGTFVANVTATTARLYLDQTVVNSAAKVVAHLIK
jgi:hypothetical protein